MAPLTKLADLTARVTKDADPVARAQALWESKPKKAFAEVRSQLEAMAPGHARCMYCEDSRGTDIDHFRPKVSFPAHAFVWTNYLLACSSCNSNQKRDAFPVDSQGDPLLLDPSVDEPTQHLVFTPTTGHLLACGAKGPESIRVFGLNDDTRRLPTGRRQALIGLVALLEKYNRTWAHDPVKAQEIRTAMIDHPFSAVLHWLVRIAQTNAGPAVLGEEVVALVQNHQVDRWL